MQDLLRDILDHLHNIQRSHKGSIGSINNTYLPQLRVDLVDELEVRVSARLLTTVAPDQAITAFSKLINEAEGIMLSAQQDGDECPHLEIAIDQARQGLARLAGQTRLAGEL